MADRQRIMIPFAVQEAIHKRVNPRKGQLGGALQGMIGECLKANGVKSVAATEMLTMLGLSSMRSTGNWTTQAEALQTEANALLATNKLIFAKALALYFDNINFSAFIQGMWLNKATGKNYVYCSWCFPDSDKVRKIVNSTRLSIDAKSWDEIVAERKLLQRDMLLEETDSLMLDEQQIRRAASVLEVYHRAQADEFSVLPEELPERSPTTSLLHADVDFAVP
jgi:hypothetical protein